MSRIVHTLNSRYELDEENSRVRRLGGFNEPTPNQGADGEWKTYVSFHQLHDDSLLFVWDHGGNNATRTSRVVMSKEGA